MGDNPPFDEWTPGFRASDVPITPGGDPSPFADLADEPKPQDAMPAANGHDPRIRLTISGNRPGAAHPGEEANDPPQGSAGKLEPDREALLQFAALMFRNAIPDGFVSLRAFRDNDRRDEKPILIEAIQLGDADFAAILFERARQAAAWDDPAVFCPPVATFRNHQNAKTGNLLQGVDLSTECDQAPQAARSTLEALLGPATAVVESGGEWINPATGEIEPKVHLHWRLKTPTSTRAEHDLLKEARTLAANLVCGDGTNKSVVHPIRWPGSWHRKKTPRLAKIVASSDDSEIDLTEAIEILREATGAAAFTGFGFDFKKTGGRKLEADDHAAAAAALSVIPNNDLEWVDWNRIGMAAWAATGGSEIGRKAFAEWSAKSKKNDPAATEARWQHYRTSPPTKLGFGTLVYLARQHSPGWSYEKAEAESNPGSSTPNQVPQGAGQSQQAPPQYKGKSGGPTAPANSEEFLALSFIDRHEADLRFVAKWGQWFRWDGLRWALEETLHAFDMARLICREAANACNKPGVAKALASAKTVAAVERLAKADRKVAATFEQWDTDPDKFNTSEKD